MQSEILFHLLVPNEKLCSCLDAGTTMQITFHGVGVVVIVYTMILVTFFYMKFLEMRKFLP